MDITPKTIFAAVAGVTILTVSANSFVITDETERKADYRFGELVTQDASQLRQPGPSFKIPFITKTKGIRVDLQGIDYDNVQTYTKDNQVITAELTVLYRIPEGKIIEILKKNPDYQSKMERIALDSAKSALGQQEAQNVAQNREVIMQSVTEQTAREVESLLGIEIVAVKMPNFDFNDAFEKAVENAANEKAELDRKRTKQEQARVDKETTIINAEAANKAAKLKADAQAYAQRVASEEQAKGNLALAEAEAKGFEVIKKAVGVENMNTYLTTNKWKGDVPTVAGNGGATIVDLGQVAATQKARGPSR